MVQFLQQVISGVSIGCVYALIALGFVLIYKATETVNFAIGELMMIGAFLGFTFIVIWSLPLWLAAIIAISATALLAAMLERVFLRPMVGEPAFAILVVTIGLGFCLRAAALMVPEWSSETVRIFTPLSGSVVRLGPIVISADHAAVIVATALIVTGFFVFFKRTRMGLAMQAVSQSQLAATYMGVRTRSVSTLAWLLAGAITAVAGLLLAPIAFIHVNMGVLGLKAIPAAIIGGFSSLPGAIVGGILLGVCESLAGFYLPAGFSEVAAYILVLVVLTIRPEGLFGETIHKRV
ncbi:branched-chain amino acid ABC transporter permease [Mesorhizobium microcysteis]|uniref:Branched-chain amino acid ABC transporter permease n=1 Tax=Neoaquamicrobium microcysteis TaxID=2682781 RepID=A0A5D4H1N5_9HYPH|nr:branched-chain amino acid ABC transporter permease [Mesorhizobium microcysteis]TYR33425.1 branched-chain amino acid ABC transporter permease [Mesorhizobium microcysteis]